MIAKCRSQLNMIHMNGYCCYIYDCLLAGLVKAWFCAEVASATFPSPPARSLGQTVMTHPSTMLQTSALARAWPCCCLLQPITVAMGRSNCVTAHLQFCPAMRLSPLPVPTPVPTPRSAAPHSNTITRRSKQRGPAGWGGAGASGSKVLLDNEGG